MNSKEENSYDFCPKYVQEFGLWIRIRQDLLHCIVPDSDPNVSYLSRSDLALLFYKKTVRLIIISLIGKLKKRK